MMSADVLGMVLAGAGFVIAFAVARWLSRGMRERRRARAEAEAQARQSRQVRRAQARQRQR
jgi:predicted amino acid dehydrogenase